MTFAWFFASKLGRLTSLIIVGALVASLFYATAYRAGQADLINKQNERSLEAWEKHNEIETDTDRLSDHDLCIKLGGMPDDCTW